MKKIQKLRSKILLISLVLFPLVYYYLSPYLIIDGALKGIVTGSFIVFTMLFIGSLFLGRLYCGWICPAGSLQKCLSKFNNKKPKKADWLKYVIWMLWISLIIHFFIKAEGIKSIQPFYQTYYGISISNIYSLIMFMLIAGFIAGIALLFGKRSFCHYLCWMAPFMTIGRKISNYLKLPSIKLKADKKLVYKLHGLQ